MRGFSYIAIFLLPTAAANRVRIIGGAFRRRVIRFPPATGLRPTPDRVRETLFNWLGQDLSGRRCLDPYAGSGALTLEAASRGAALAVAVDRDGVLVDALRATSAALALVPSRRMSGTPGLSSRTSGAIST
jgi:16S rRNA (guanine966-N2)-methyltransferase